MAEAIEHVGRRYEAEYGAGQQGQKRHDVIARLSGYEQHARAGQDEQDQSLFNRHAERCGASDGGHWLADAINLGYTARLRKTL